MVVPDDLVRLEIPALDHLCAVLSAHHPDLGVGSSSTHLVLSAREEIRMPVRHGEATNGRDVTGERELELPTCQVPDLHTHRTRQLAPLSRHTTRRTLMTLSPAPVANHLFPGSTATALTQPRWPEMTRMRRHWAW